MKVMYRNKNIISDDNYYLRIIITLELPSMNKKDFQGGNCVIEHGKKNFQSEKLYKSSIFIYLCVKTFMIHHKNCPLSCFTMEGRGGSQRPDTAKDLAPFNGSEIL